MLKKIEKRQGRSEDVQGSWTLIPERSKAK
jgi:hypothetical protein